VSDEHLGFNVRYPVNDLGAKTGQNLKIPIRHYQIARVYGPGMAASCEEGLTEKVLEKPVGQVGLVLVHCWNLGEATGPYPIGAGVHCTGEVADWVPTAHEIITDKIVPVLDVARKAGIAIFHLAQSTYASRYPQYLRIAVDPELRPPGPPEPIAGCVRPRSFEEHWLEQYGADFPGPVWETHADQFDVAEAVRPLPNENVVVDGWQLNGLCRRMDIDTLFYAGFMADLCLMNIPGAIREMFATFGYHCVALRDCTTAYEFADTYEGQWMTRAAIRLLETDLGYTASSEDFIAAAVRVSAA
jgi:nicotinamidase-related amidase